MAPEPAPERTLMMRVRLAARRQRSPRRASIWCTARALKRAIQASIENPLAKRILEGEFGAKDMVKIAAKGGAIQFGEG